MLAQYASIVLRKMLNGFKGSGLKGVVLKEQSLCEKFKNIDNQIGDFGVIIRIIRFRSKRLIKRKIKTYKNIYFSCNRRLMYENIALIERMVC